MPMNITNSVRLQSGHYSSPEATYTRLMKSSTRLNPLRQPYVPMRMVNEVYGKMINRERQDGHTRVNECLGRRDEARSRRLDDAKKQGLELHFDSLHL
jgi:hypothetical protein